VQGVYILDWSQCKIFVIYLLIQNGDVDTAAKLSCKQGLT